MEELTSQQLLRDLIMTWWWDRRIISKSSLNIRRRWSRKILRWKNCKLRLMRWKKRIIRCGLKYKKWMMLCQIRKWFRILLICLIGNSSISFLTRLNRQKIEVLQKILRNWENLKELKLSRKFLSMFKINLL